MTSAARARALITRIRSGRLRHNPDVAELCRIVSIALDLGDVESPAKPARELYKENQTLYMKHYMRWWRATGQAGEGRP